MIVGEVRWVELPPRGGHAQKGRRPAIIVQDQRASARLPTILIVPLTSQLDELRFPGTVLVEGDRDNKLRRPSIALVFQLTAIDRGYLSNQRKQIPACGAGDSIKPGVERSGTPGIGNNKTSQPAKRATAS